MIRRAARRGCCSASLGGARCSRRPPRRTRWATSPPTSTPGLRVTAAGIDIDYVLDLAELPAYQARARRSTPTTTDPSTAERDAYAARTCAAAAAHRVTVGGQRQPLTARPAGLTFPPGAGGLTTLRLQCVLHADARITDGTTITLPSTPVRRPDRLARDHRRRRPVHADPLHVPGGQRQRAAHRVPRGRGDLDVRSRDPHRAPRRTGGGPAAPFAATGTGGQARDVDRFTAWFTDLVGHPQLTLGVGILAFLIALVLGGAHAVAPGHGKTIMAAYLVGSRGPAAPGADGGGHGGGHPHAGGAGPGHPAGHVAAAGPRHDVRLAAPR